MFDDEVVKRPTQHQVGMPIDTMSVGELTERIGLLRGEIERLERAIASREKSRATADALFKSS